MTNTQRKQVISKATAVLYARRSGNVAREQKAYDTLRACCDKLDLDITAVLPQVEQHLRQTSIAASMNGIV